MTESMLLWTGFTVLVGLMLLVDIVLVGRGEREMSFRKALLWSGLWISIALLFNAGLFLVLGKAKGLEFLTGYLVEKSLSVDNLFVFLVIFGYFVVPPGIQPKALTWAIIGALAMRLGFILVGAALLNAFHWVIFIFGGFLILTAVRLATHQEQNVHPERNPLVRLLRLLVPVTPEYHGDRFFLRQDGRLTATPLLATMVVLASTDLVFAVDSIPAIFAITTDPFIVYTSNAFAILGMRALYFALAGLLKYFVYLKHALVAILFFVGSKMIASEWYHVSAFVSFLVVASILAVAIAASVVLRRGTPVSPAENAGVGPRHPAAEPRS